MADGDEKKLQADHETALEGFIAARGGRGRVSDWALVRALVHKAVHLAADGQSVEFCGVATLLADMIAHAHQVMHPAEPTTASQDHDVH